MTVKEERESNYLGPFKLTEGKCTYIGPFQMTELSPVLGPNYSKHLIHDKYNNNFVHDWDLTMGVNNLSAAIESFKKALDKKNGIEKKEYDTKDLYHMQIDA